LLWLMIGPVWDLAAAVDEIEIEVEWELGFWNEIGIGKKDCLRETQDLKTATAAAEE
jgi:hypothetical protein